MLKYQQPESIEDYTEQLRKRLNGVLPPEKIEEIAQETQMHLADKAEELRNNPDVYERQAVAGFTPVNRYSRLLMRAWSVAYARHRGTKFLQNLSLVGVSGLMLALIANVVLASKIPDLQFDWIFHGGYIILSALIGIFILAIFACRHQLKRMIYFCMATSAVVFLSYGFLCGSAYEPHVIFSPFDNREVLSRLDARKEYKWTRAQYDSTRNKILRIDKEMKNISSLKNELLFRDNLNNSQIINRTIEISELGLKKIRFRNILTARKLIDNIDLSTQKYIVEIREHRNIVEIIEKQATLLQERNELVKELGSWTYRMNAQIALMARPRGTFDWGVARSAAGNMLYITGFFLVSDLVGGWLGMLCLQAARRWRNRRRGANTPPLARG
jgi:hypothetical protein